MAWKDKPSEAQLGTIFSWYRWVLPTDTARKACMYLENNATKGQVSAEMRRIKPLKDKRLLNETNCFDSLLWKEFKV